MSRAFEGVRVIDLTQVFAGPYATSMLALLGADVIKVEPLRGDQARRLLDHGDYAAAGMSPAFLGLNAGKRSLAIDLKQPAAVDVLRRLVAGADVFVENSRPGAMARMGLDYETLRAERPDLIYCSVSGYGQTGPKRDAPAYDGAIQAASGLMSIGGEPGEPPLRVAFPVIDMTTGLTAGLALASALYRRAMTGEGQFLDVAMFDAAISLMSPVVNSFVVGGSEPVQTGNSSLTFQPTTDLFPTRDGAVQIAALTEEQIRAFCRDIGLPELLEDERFASIQAQIANREAMREAIAPIIAQETSADWERRLSAAGVPVGRVVTIPEAIAEPQAAHRELLRSVGGPFGDPIQIVGAGFRAGDGNPEPSGPAPRLGQHTDAILRELGLAAAEIAALRRDGVVLGPPPD